MAALRRGIMRYADGTSDVPPGGRPTLGLVLPTVPALTPADVRQISAATTLPPVTQIPPPVFPDTAPAPAPAPAPASSFRQVLGDAIGMRGPEVRANVFQPSPAAGPPSAAGQLLSGQYGEALANPTASGLTRSWAQANLEARAANLQNQGPGWATRAYNFIAGDPSTDAALQARTDAAKFFQDKKMQQHLVNNPDELRMAEDNPVEYAKTAQLPQFQRFIQSSVDTHAAAADPQGILHPDGTRKIPPDPTQPAQLAATTGVPLHQANAVLNHHQYTQDEFVNAMRGVSWKTLGMVLGPAFTQMAEPKNRLMNEFLGGMNTSYQTTLNAVNALQEANKITTDPVEKARNVDQINRLTTGKGGLNEIKAAREDAVMKILGITKPGIPMPLRTN